MKLGAIVGRFQVPELHEGHRQLIQFVKEQNGQVMILLGVSQVLGSKRHPLDFVTREKMIKAEFPDAIVAPLPDMPTDEAWSQNLDALVRMVNPLGEVILYGGRDSFIPYYKGKFKTYEIELKYAPSGTDVRHIAANKVLVSSDFRAGVIYATANQYRRVFPTVDIAILRDAQVLLGKKPNQDLWCFPGGFVDQEDECLEQAAAREASEECNVDIQMADLHYVCSHRNKDWRYRHKDDGVITTCLYSADRWTGTPTAGDDLAEVMWFPLELLTKERMVSTHQDLFVNLLLKHGSKKPRGENYV